MEQIKITVHIHIPPELAHLLNKAEPENISTNLEEAQQLHHEQAEPCEATRRGVSTPHPGAKGRTVPRAAVGVTRGIVLATLRKLAPQAVTAKPIARRLGITGSAVCFHLRQLHQAGLVEPCGKIGKSMQWIAVEDQS